MIELPENVIAEIMSSMRYHDVGALFCTHRRFRPIFEKYLIIDYTIDWQSHVQVTANNSEFFRLVTQFNTYIIQHERLESLTDTKLERIFAAITTPNVHLILQARAALRDLADMLIPKLIMRCNERTLEVFIVVTKYFHQIYNCGANVCYYKLATEATKYDHIELVELLHRHDIVFHNLITVRNSYLFRTAVVYKSDRVLKFIRSKYTDPQGEFVGQCYHDDIPMALQKLIAIDHLERPQACCSAMHYVLRSGFECEDIIRMLVATGYLHTGILLSDVMMTPDVSLSIYILALQSTDDEYINGIITRVYMIDRLDVLDYIIETYGTPDDLLQLINVEKYTGSSYNKKLTPVHPNVIAARYNLTALPEDDLTCVCYRKLIEQG